MVAVSALGVLRCRRCGSTGAVLTMPAWIPWTQRPSTPLQKYTADADALAVAVGAGTGSGTRSAPLALLQAALIMLR